MFLSVIIPVHNAGKYLDRCLRSVITAFENTKIEGEILLINNNSTDDSEKIIERYLKARPVKMHKFECKTPGAAAARNFGISRAKGVYVWFIDADDSVRKDAIELLYNKARQTNPDLLMFGAKRIYQNGNTDCLSAVDGSKNDYKSRFVRYGSGPWQFIFRRAWWQEHNFRFREGIIHEDMEMISSLILYTDNFVCVDQPLYNYFQNSESVLHKGNWDPHYLDIFPALEGLYTRFEEMHATKDYHDELEWFFIWNLLIDSAKDFGNFKEGKIGFKRSRAMLNHYFPHWRKNKFLKQKPLKLQLRTRLNYYK